VCLGLTGDKIKMKTIKVVAAVIKAVNIIITTITTLLAILTPPSLLSVIISLSHFVNKCNNFY